MERTMWQNSWVRAVTTLLTAAVMVMIFCFSMENAEKSDRRSGVLSSLAISVLYPEYDKLEEGQQQAIYDNVQHVVRKCAHFSEYMILGFLIRLCLESWFGHKLKKLRILALIGFGSGAAYACTDEFHQRSVEGRSGQWTDVLVDSSGVLAGVILGTLMIRSLNRRTTDETDT